MMRCNIAGVASAIIAALLMCGCSTVKPESADIFHVDPAEAKIVFYVSYDNPDDEPSFGETFPLHIDAGYIGNIGDDEFIVAKVTPGERILDADQVGWAGNSANHTTLKVQAKAGTVSFVTEHIAPDKKPVLSIINNNQGMKDMPTRTRVCLCG